MKAFLATLCVVVGVAVSSPQGGSGGGYGYEAPQQQQHYQDTPAQYNFQWDVNDDYSGNFYGHQEQRDGDNTQGRYYVRLPDSRLMKVEYYVDQYGYHPTITYEGEAQYPQQQQYNARPSKQYTQPEQQYVQPAQQYSQPEQQYSQPEQQYSQPQQKPQRFYNRPGK